MKKPNARFTKKATIWGLVISALGVLGIGGWHIAPWVEASAFREHEAKNRKTYRMFTENLEEVAQKSADDLRRVANKTLEAAREQTFRNLIIVRERKTMKFRGINPTPQDIVNEQERQRDLIAHEAKLEQRLKEIKAEQKKYE